MSTTGKVHNVLNCTKTHLFGGNERVVDEVWQCGVRADVVEAVRSTQQLVCWVVHHCRVESVETNEVRHLALVLR